ncbi:MAG TPA: hypothetical protein VIV35_11345, partial [Chitinophagaceae bacterium]
MNKTKIINCIFRANFLTGIFILFLVMDGYAQARWQADVSITSVSITPMLKKVPRVTDNINKPDQKVVQASDDNLKCTIMIHNENDDDAQGTKML